MSTCEASCLSMRCSLRIELAEGSLVPLATDGACGLEAYCLLSFQTLWLSFRSCRHVETMMKKSALRICSMGELSLAHVGTQIFRGVMLSVRLAHQLIFWSAFNESYRNNLPRQVRTNVNGKWYCNMLRNVYCSIYFAMHECLLLRARLHAHHHSSLVIPVTLHSTCSIPSKKQGRKNFRLICRKTFVVFSSWWERKI